MRLLVALLAASTLTACDPVVCSIPQEDGVSNNRGCSGEVLASGSMENSDLATDAELHCQNLFNPAVTCCSYTFSSEGEWYATDGWVVEDDGVPDAGHRSAGTCSTGQ